VVTTTEALTRIAELVGPRGVVTGADAAPLLIDHRQLYRGAAALVVRPESTEQVAEVVRLCNEAGIGVVPQGGNTGYCGGATPFDGERQILLCLSRMNRVRELDPLGFTLTVEAGVILAHVQAAAERAGLMFPLSMGSEGSCQIGGNLSTNAGGLAVLRYGTARELVLGLEVVLPNGEILSDLKGLRKDNTGFELKSLFLGAEGTLGVITAAVLKLFPPAATRQTAFLALASPAAACELLARARRVSGDRVVSAEFVSRRSLNLVLKHVAGARDPFAQEYEHYMLLELASADDEAYLRATLERILTAALDAGDVLDGVVADSGAQRSALWLLRERIPEAERHEGGSIKHDISVRISRIPEFLARAEPELKLRGPHRLSIYGHIGDGNLHFNLLPPEGQSLADFYAGYGKALAEYVHDLAADMDGSFSAEHGVGILKRDELAQYESPAAHGLMRRIKGALDPQGIMNPGKLFRPAGVD
jgi:FAD/FMN-containing dehydrogenase